MTSARLLAVHAHPDDETLFTGGTLAHYADAGVEVSVVTFTNGERGAVSDRVRRGALTDGKGLGTVRLEELWRACRLLGVTNLFPLGYGDSGNEPQAAVDDLSAFANCDRAEAVARLTQLVRRVRPQVVVTYNARGIYGHIDHIRAHEITLEAVAAVGNEMVRKLYFVLLPRWVVKEELLIPLLQIDADLFDDRNRSAKIVERWSATDDEVTTAIDIPGKVDVKYRALSCYESQSDALRPFLDQPLGDWPRREYFQLASTVYQRHEWETDLFAGLA